MDFLKLQTSNGGRRHECRIASTNQIAWLSAKPLLKYRGFEFLRWRTLQSWILKILKWTPNQTHFSEIDCGLLTTHSHLPVTASTIRGDLQVLSCCTNSFGPRSFAVRAPKLWNSLPPCDPTVTLTLFCSRLKTHLFGLAYGHALMTA